MRIPFAREGWPFIVAGLVLLALLALAHQRALLAASLPLVLLVVWFFRDPERAVPADEGLLVSPADGKVVEVVPQPGGGTRVSVFLSIFNVHVNRAPVGGEVTEVRHQPGRFLAAMKAEASAQNEQTSVTVRHPRGDVRFAQIAGLIARRIVCHLAPGQRVARGERYGLIRFGSRMDIFLPPAAEPLVRPGDTVHGGSDAIARWR